mmetsp:Transcript_23180/g.39657  ORF Transcript_23180/g.39657 Transcript_23180/m.39657 type:complete len:309 (+) Transcript_23180:727-1653(+)
MTECFETRFSPSVAEPDRLRIFLSRYGRSGIGADPEWIANTLVSDPAKLLVHWQEERIGGVAAVLDRLDTAQNTAELVLLAVHPDAPAPKMLIDLVDRAEVIAAAGPRTALEISIQPDLSAAKPQLIRRGYQEAYSIFDLSKSSYEGVKPELTGFKVQELTSSSVGEYYRCVRSAFADIPGVSIPNPELFAKTSLSYSPSPMLLWRGDQLVGFVRVSSTSDGLGTIELLGRNPAFRGQLIGRALLRIGMERLRKIGVHKMIVQVSAASVHAIELYKEEGFEVVSETPVVRKPVQSDLQIRPIDLAPIA